MVDVNCFCFRWFCFVGSGWRSCGVWCGLSGIVIRFFEIFDWFGYCGVWYIGFGICGNILICVWR